MVETKGPGCAWVFPVPGAARPSTNVCVMAALDVYSSTTAMSDSRD